MKLTKLIALISIVALWGCKEEPKPFNGLDMNMGNLFRTSDAQTRSISPENFTGEKGKGGTATLEEGNAFLASTQFFWHRIHRCAGSPIISHKK